MIHEHGTAQFCYIFDALFPSCCCHTTSHSAMEWKKITGYFAVFLCRFLLFLIIFILSWILLGKPNINTSFLTVSPCSFQPQLSLHMCCRQTNFQTLNHRRKSSLFGIRSGFQTSNFTCSDSNAYKVNEGKRMNQLLLTSSEFSLISGCTN